MIRPAILPLLLLCCSESQMQDGGSDTGEPVDTGARLDAAATDADPLDADPSDAAPADADPSDADPTDADPVDADPTDAGGSDGGRGCAEIEADYRALVTSTGCQDLMQCQVVNGHCDVGLGGCWYTVNISVMQSALNMLAAEWLMLGCRGGVCRCTAPPSGAICEQGICMPAP